MAWDYDLIVIGAGSGGVRAARLAAARGKRVAVIERDRVGGTCVNVGCIPKKLFHYAAHYASDFREAAGFGWQVPPPVFDWPTLLANKDREIARLNGIYQQLLQNAGATLLQGDARLQDGHTVVVGEQRLTAERILLAVGGAPRVPSLPGSELGMTSNDFFALSTLPASVIVVGGGYIAVELAGILHGLGVAVTLLHRGDALLRGFDDDIRQHLQHAMAQQGIRLLLGDTPARLDRQGEGVQLTLAGSGAVLEAGAVLFATGRAPALAGLGLEHTAVRLSPSGHVQVNDRYQTDEPGIHAIGDVVGRKELTPVATAEAMWLVDHWYGPGTRPPLRYETIASAVFSSPPIGTVGLSQQAAEAAYGAGAIRVWRSEFRPLRQTLGGSSERVLMKLVVHGPDDRVLGLHMVGPEAGEIIQGFAVALQMGVTKAQLDQTIGIHPTAAEEFVTMR